jgi:hypothetical protein
MKANKHFRSLNSDNAGAIEVIGAVVGLLLLIVLGIMVFYSVFDTTGMSGTTVETFTGYSASANASAWTITVTDSPTGSSDVNVTCYNATGKTESYPVFSLTHKTVGVAADAADEFTQVNVSYTSNKASAAGPSEDMASTVFDLLPIVALAVIAALIIGVIIGFGGGKSGV